MCEKKKLAEKVQGLEGVLKEQVRVAQLEKEQREEQATSERQELADKVEAVEEENDQLRRTAKTFEDHNRALVVEKTKLEKANLDEKGKLERKMKELQQAKQVAKDALDDSFAKDREQKETERLLEVAKKNAAEAHKASNRLNAEVQRMSLELSASNLELSASRESLTKTRGELEDLKVVLETKKGELAETQNEHKTENEALQGIIGFLTEKLTGRSNVLKETKQRLEEAKEESERQKTYLERRNKEVEEARKDFDDQKAFFESKTLEILNKEASVLKQIEEIVSSAEVSDAGELNINLI